MNIAYPLNTRIYRVAVSVFFFIAGFTFASWASRIPDIVVKLQLSEAALGTVLFALPAGQIVSLPLSGWLTSRFGSRQILIASAILYPLTLVLLAISGSVWQLAIALFLFGLWANLVNIAMNTQAVGVENMYGRSILASFHGLWSLAGFSGAAIGSFFVSADISPLLHFSIIIVVTSLLVLAFYKNTLPHDGNEKNDQPIFVKPDRRILILGLIAFCCMLCEGAMADWSGVYFQKIVQSPAALTTLGYVSFMGTMAAGRFLGDWLVTKFGVKPMLQMSGILIAAGLLIVVLFPYLAIATVGFLLVGLGVSCVVPLVYGLAGKSTTMSPGMALTAVSTISFLGFLVGPPLIGLIAQVSNLRWSFAVIAILGLGTTLLAGRIDGKVAKG
jgi:MFS family permease